MNILWISDSPNLPTGYGNVTRFVCSGLTDRDHRVDILGLQTRHSKAYGKCRLLAGDDGDFGRKSVLNAIREIRPDVVVALGNVWWGRYFLSQETRLEMTSLRIPLVFYFPIDGDTGHQCALPRAWIDDLKSVDFPVTMSRYGQYVVQQCGVPTTCIPHGVDLSLFSPPQEGREFAKAKLGYQGKFVVLCDCRNQPRKMLPRLLEIFQNFQKRKSDVLLHLHSDPLDEAATFAWYSYNLAADIRYLQLGSSIRFSSDFKNLKTNASLSRLAEIYQAADVHLLASSGEGFGLPTLQAAASGALPMACAYSASLELTRGHGEPLKISEWIKTPLGIRRAFVDISFAAEVLEKYYNDKDLLKQKSIEGRSFASQYAWTDICSTWSGFLESVKAAGCSGTQINAFSLVKRKIGSSVKQRAVTFTATLRRSEITVPATVPAYRCNDLNISRILGSQVVGSNDLVTFTKLKNIFPILSATLITEQIASIPECPGVALCLPASSPLVPYRLAQCSLLIYVESEISEDILIDAALLGVIAIGCPSPLQNRLWPGMTFPFPDDAVKAARYLLTNPNTCRRIARRARKLALAEFELRLSQLNRRLMQAVKLLS